MILVNGAVSDTVPVVDRGFAYGDGVFRTLQARRGRPLAWRYQFRRLEHDCSAIGIACPPEALLGPEIARVAENEPVCAVKIMVTRGPGQRGYAVPRESQPSRIVMSMPLPAYPASYVETGVKARICSLRLGFQPALAGIKHLNRLENVLARREWDDPDVAEGVLLDTEDNVIGGTMTNLFMARGGALITADLRRCGVSGATRDRIIARAAAHGIACTVSDLPLTEALQADELFLANSLIGVWQVRELADRSWAAGTMSQTIRRWLDEDDD
ncbi:MAG: aminodeoxychorismate lyase [Betaproteobacteria bacterium]